MQKELNMWTVNKILIRLLLISIIIFAGVLYQIYATDISGINGGATISGNLYVTSTLTVGGNEGSTASGALILWDGASCPTGWTDVSATYANTFPVGSTSAGSLGGSDTHYHFASHGHGGSVLSVGSTSHTHSLGFTEGSSSHNHGTQGCGATSTYTGTSPFDNVLYAGSFNTNTLSHTHNGYVGATTDAGDSHNHAIASSTAAPNEYSSTSSNVPVYMTLKLCKKW